MFNKNLKLENLQLKQQVEDVEIKSFVIIIFLILLIIIFSIGFYHTGYNQALEDVYCKDIKYCLFSNPFFNYE